MIITWWGHSTVALDLGGARLLTDPALTGHLAHLTRRAPPVPPLVADAVLVSHLHADHLHLPSLRRVACRQVVAPAGAEPLLRRCGVQRPELVQVGAQVRVGDVTVTAVPARHDGRRLPGSRTHGPALGYVVEHAGRRVWFAGDTGLFDGLEDIGPVDLALVPVGGWGPTLGPEHLDPVQAAEAVGRVGARHAVPIHYGTYWPTGLRSLAPGVFRRRFVEPGEAFARATAALDPAVDVHVLAVGESVEVGDG